MPKVQTRINCQVCEVSTLRKVRCGALVCEACKRFYLRYRNRPVMACRAGEDKCSGKSGKVMPSSYASNTIWRFMCTACRFAKCKAVGMGSSACENELREDPSKAIVKAETQVPSPCSSASSSTSSQQLSPCAGTFSYNGDLIVAENTIRTTIAAASKFMANMGMLELRHTNGFDQRESSLGNVWHGTMTHYQGMALNLKDFVKTLPFYRNVDVKDRCELFSKTCSRIFIAESANHSNPFPLAMNQSNFALFLTHFPDFNYVIEEQKQLFNLLMVEWRPDVVEFAFLIAFLFFSEDVCPNAKAVAEARFALSSIFDSYLRQCYSSDSSLHAVSNRHAFMNWALSVFCQAAARRQETFLRVTSCLPGALPSMNRLWAEVVEVVRRNGVAKDASESLSNDFLMLPIASVTELF